MSEWRPEGWKDTKENTLVATTDPLERALQAVSFELGADAMLAALRERAKKCAESSVLLREHLENVQADGVWVFIPEAPSVPAHEKEVGA